MFTEKQKIKMNKLPTKLVNYPKLQQ